jgi:hypothetical protein
VAAEILDDAGALSVLVCRQLLDDLSAGLPGPRECRIHVRYTHLDDVGRPAAAWRNSIGTRFGHDYRPI